MLGLQRLGVTYLAHDVDTVSNHNQDDTHVLGKGDEKVSEVLALDDGILFIEFLYLDETTQDVSHVVAKLLLRLLDGEEAGRSAFIQHDGEDGVTAQANLVNSNLGCLQAVKDRIKTEDVTLDKSTLNGAQQVFFQFREVVWLKSVGDLFPKI